MRVNLNLLLLCAGLATGGPGAPIKFEADAQGYVGSKACATCHGDVARMYGKTAMGQASGYASELPLATGEVIARKAGAAYSISGQRHPQLHYRKKMSDGSVLEGAKDLKYYIGSGAHGRGFVFEEAGQPFQAPVAYYGEARGWDLAPGYEEETSILLGRKIEKGCISCHASGFTSKQPVLFAEGAVSCERCHGPGAEHVAVVQSGKPTGSLRIVNPSKLEPESRDSVCAQCHLTGQTRVMKAGRSEATYRPGEHLADHVVPFVPASSNRAELKVVGHFEGLWQSKCKRVSGDKLSCLTCHDPHTTVAPANRNAYYRAKCLSCHQETSCKLPIARRTAEGDSCIGCHMQTRASSDGQHTSFTDHSISRSNAAPSQASHSDHLVSFWPSRATDRDTALAYASEATIRGDAASIRQAHQKLQAVWSSGGGDAAVATQLEYSEDLLGATGKAGTLYRQALKSEPEDLTALTNLATHLARGGNLEEAIKLWRKALLINPGLQAPGLNLATAEEMEGHRPEALEVLRQVLSLNPDLAPALKLRSELESKDHEAPVQRENGKR